MFISCDWVRRLCFQLEFISNFSKYWLRKTICKEVWKIYSWWTRYWKWLAKIFFFHLFKKVLKLGLALFWKFFYAFCLKRVLFLFCQYMRRKNSINQTDLEDLKRQNNHLEVQIRALEKAKTVGNFSSAKEILSDQELMAEGENLPNSNDLGNSGPTGGSNRSDRQDHTQ